MEKVIVMEKPTELAIRMRRIRVTSGLTQQMVASCLQISRSTYGYFENGKSMPSREMLDKLAKLYDVPVEVFYAA